MVEIFPVSSQKSAMGMSRRGNEGFDIRAWAGKRKEKSKMAKIATFYDHMKDISRQEGVSLAEAMKEAKALGVELLEISQNNILGREDEVGHELAYAGLGISSIPSYFDFGRDADVNRQSEPVLEAARYLGADRLLVIPGFHREEDGREERARQVKAMEEGINRLADKAAGYGVSLVMEDFDSELAPYSTIDGLLEFLGNCPGLSCCFDTGNFRYMAENEMEAFEALKGRIAHVHLKDRAYRQSNGEAAKTAIDDQKLYPCPVGYGEIKIAELLEKLRQNGYHGAYTIEHYDSAATLDYLKKSAAWLKERL